jgi:hypothetical protein
MNKLTFIKSGGILIFLFSQMLLSCKKEQTDNIYTDGVYISNEGNWGSGNASVSFYSNIEDKIYNDIFTRANNRPLGDVLQSMTYYEGNIYLVLNASNKVEVVDDASFTETGVIEGVSSPRYMVASGTKGYISCWNDNSVKVVNLNTLQLTNSISTGLAPEKMMVLNDKLLVANSGGINQTDSTITVIDLSNETVTQNINVGYNPKDVELDFNGNLWVLCYGKEIYDANYNVIEQSKSELVKLSGSDFSILNRITIADSSHFSNLSISKDGKFLYYGVNFALPGIYKLSVNGPTQGGTLFLDDNAYGFFINARNEEFFVTLAPSFTDAGVLKRYNSEGQLLGTYETGIGPNGGVDLK